MKRLPPFALLTSAWFMALHAALSSASAQSLPRLNARAVSNRTLSISWPCTNAGFALQESGGFQAASNWQSSTLAPAFDSNSAAFSVSAAATNAARFFRLKQPADLRVPVSHY
jgi:hypothetical protein